MYTKYNIDESRNKNILFERKKIMKKIVTSSKKTTLTRVVRGIKKAAPYAMGFAFAMLAGVASFAFADTTASDEDIAFITKILTWIIRGIGLVPAVPGVLSAIEGLAAYNEARENSGGPEADKAKKKMGTAITSLLLVAIIQASAATIASTIAGFINRGII